MPPLPGVTFACQKDRVNPTIGYQTEGQLQMAVPYPCPKGCGGMYISSVESNVRKLKCPGCGREDEATV
jgi:hypothetical protein